MAPLSFLEGSKKVIIPKHFAKELIANPQAFHEMWSPHIKVFGGEESYQEFLKTYAGESQHVQHELAHLFGGSLYAVADLPGVTICDHQFNGGCFHEFIGKAIQDRGVEIVSSLNEECLKVPRSGRDGCQHGIGHGLTGFLGYRYKDLTEALEICEDLPGQSKVGGCTGGIFMEFNTEILLSIEGKIRTFNPDLGYHYPCNSIEKEDRGACYFRQPQWWLLLSGGKWNSDKGQEEMFSEIKKLCSEVVVEEERMYCYRGLGTHGMVVVDGETEKMISICKSISELSGEVECRAGAARSPHIKLLASTNPWGVMCNGLNEKVQKSCILIAQGPE